MNKRRFPGINPFQTDEQDRFFGRDDDIRELHALIALEKVVVLFGKSGHGKSSLLNAGIVPRFLSERPGSERRYEPLVIKFGAHVPGKTPPAENARQFLEKNFPPAPEAATLPGAAGETLWWAAKRSGLRRIVLIFDQFEEFFTYPLAQQERFADEIGELLHTDLPPALAARFAELSEESQDFLAEKLDVKAVFAIREDRLHLLDKLKYPLPAIFARRFPLLPLPRAQAREAIEKPASLAGFDTPPFTFSPDAMDEILDFLADKDGRVETNQLQILAESFEKRAENEGVAQFTIENLGALKKIVADYYHDKIDDLPDEASRLAARRLCEEGLAQDGDPPVRLNLHEAQIRQFYDIGPALLEDLVKKRLLRAEPGAGGGYTYELPHDTLLEPVLDAKRLRLEANARVRAKEAAEAAERRAREAEAQAAEEKQRAEEAERLKNEAVQGHRRARVLSVLSALTAILAIVAAVFAFQKTRESERAKTEANRKLLEALHEKQQRLDLELSQLDRAKTVYEKAGHEVLLQETGEKMQSLQAQVRENQTAIREATQNTTSQQ